ncbi:hypothetical protein HD806DRAFT_416871 [Xylariaceae sp. AK1471]|nr:hypothetical protein HD806DRAFT_416871 [Xylariaceae sp. AK1471]
MSSPVKTSPPTALDRSGGPLGDRNGVDRDGPLAAPHHGLPMPGLSGRANSSIADDQQATSSKGPSTTTASSRAPRSWSASSLTSRPRCTSRRACGATSSWGFTNHDQQHHVSALHGNSNGNNALITGLFFLGGSNSDNGGGQFQVGNLRVRLQTSSQGFLLGVGRGSVSILRIALRFTLDFVDDGDHGLEGGENENTKSERDRYANQEKRYASNNKVEPETENQGNMAGEMEGEHSQSLSLTMTITIMAVNTPTLS